MLEKQFYYIKLKKLMDDDYLIVFVDFSISHTYKTCEITLKGLIDYYFQKIITEANLIHLNTLETYIEKFF